ncbi:DNA polymerase [Sulfuricaulis limicola]|uniref:Type-4 uracil-DNA glycosylase n=1 Tax=Sulfuricaulis limicola TaxID=1620215 RepID=A0A1B4XEE8_9GAMM|nr:uracil-DNA glycosylase [Sulfuricaulis limicola]BAV33179.1 DNA polymerase [Sulfuricaulis limicola]
MNVQNEMRRRQYLDALGITRWEPRQAPASVSPEIRVGTETPAVPSRSVPGPVLIREADTAVDNSRDWTELEAEVRACTQCSLHKTRTQTVFGVGHRHASWMFIGEAPGADEDRQGEPFVGRAGQLLNAILFAMGLKREEVYIANVLKCRPPGNRDPQPEEVTQCEPYLIRQIGLIRPKLIVALGRHAAHSLLKTEVPLAKLRGQKLSYHGTPLFVTYHPAYLLRNPADKRKVWDDLCRAKAAMTNLEES